MKRIFTGLYWDITVSPLKNKSVDDLKNFNRPNPVPINIALLEQEQKRAIGLYENTELPVPTTFKRMFRLKAL